MTSAVSAVIDRDPASWRRVSTIADLAWIFEPGVQVCSWQRAIDPRITAYLDGVAGLGTLQVLETLKPGERARLADLPVEQGREHLIDDVALLSTILADLLDCSAVGLRCTRVEHAMCPVWHVDRVPLRLLCTYGGPGTEWLDDQGVDHAELKRPAIAEGACRRAVAGELVLLKGALWQDNDGFGAIHRSPAIAAGEGRRTLLTLDPLWLG